MTDTDDIRNLKQAVKDLAGVVEALTMAMRSDPKLTGTPTATAAGLATTQAHNIKAGL